MKLKGFTLIEVILVIAVITGIGAFVIPTTINQIYFSRAEGMANILVSSLYSQQQYSFNGYENSEYGVKIESDRLSLYTGNSYASKTYEKVIDSEGVIYTPTLSSGNEIHFDNSNLKPTSHGTIRIDYAGIFVDVIINSEGLAYIQR